MVDLPENQKPKDEAGETKLGLLLFQLGELVKDPPTTVDLYDWRYNIDHVMKEIKDLAPDYYEQLDDLVTAVQMEGERHVSDIDAEEAPNVIAHSGEHYFAKVAHLISEINRLKSF